MSSVRVTRSSCATFRPVSASASSGRSTLKRARSPSSDSSRDTGRPLKRSCIEQGGPADPQSAMSTIGIRGQGVEDDDDDEDDDYDDMPALESIPSSPVIGPLTSGPRMPPPSKTAAYSDAVLQAASALAAASSPPPSTTVERTSIPMAVDSVEDLTLEPVEDIAQGAAPLAAPVQAAEPELDPDDTDAGGHPDFEGVKHIPINALERAVAFAGKCDRPNNRFAISKIPTDAAWGTSAQTEKFLCVDERPLTVWLVGTVRTTWFFNLEGLPQPRVNIGITLPHKGDADALRRLLQRACPHRDDVPSILYASRFQSRQQKGDIEPTIMPFKNVYDARTRFRAKSEMPLLPPSCIGRNDLVLVEAYFNRWKTAKDRKNRKSWTLWDVGFELQCVSLLSEAPTSVEDDELVPNADLADDM